MRIKDLCPSPHNNLTKCTKMTEEHRVHGMNGTNKSGIAAIKEDSPQSTDTYSVGGRLKFFKNGKFILELARAREGEKIAWVPVQKKTFWPPQGSTSTVAAYRQESSTSLSVSDDNSSVQSSPWQRDHTWKQSTPLRNASAHLSFWYSRGGGGRRRHSCRTQWLLRRPHRAPDGPAQSIKCNRCVKSAMIDARKRPSLTSVVDALKSKCRQPVSCVTSPRKRILRELERVTIDDLSLKRCRAKVEQAAVITAPASQPAAPSPAPPTNGLADMNGAARCPPVPSSKNCSYSIMSLLGGKLDNREDKLSSQFVPVSRAAHQEPAHDVVDAATHRPPAHYMNAASKKGGLPAAVAAHTGGGVGGGAELPAHHNLQHPYMAPYMYSPSVVGHDYVSSYYSSYSRGSYFPTLPVPLVRPDALSYSWIPSYDPLAREDTISDVPLNLSKHAD